LQFEYFSPEFSIAVLLSDQDIITALRKGDKQVFEMIFRHYYQRLCNYAGTILNDMDEAEECVQQVFLTVWEKRESNAISTSVKSYLYRAVYNSSLNRIKHEKVKQLYAQTEKALEQSELQQEIQKAIALLPEQCRMVFKLSRFEDMKYSEIATHLNISVKTVENHMGKALKLMREQLKDYLPILLLLMPWLIR
jgi:RNA polymerase sigma-70 factor, ECF subfamily